METLVNKPESCRRPIEEGAEAGKDDERERKVKDCNSKE
jgi:hypothetical protein